MPVYGLPAIRAVAAGDNHSLALAHDGTVWAWGDNSKGQIGDGGTGAALAPKQVPNLSGVTAIAAGGRMSLALKGDGTLWTWGDNGQGQLGRGSTGGIGAQPVRVATLSNVTAMAAGALHALAVTSDGAAWAWGDNTYGQLGNGATTSTPSPSPTRVSGFPRPAGSPDAGAGAGVVAAGLRHSIVLADNGSVWAFGANDAYQLGDNTTTPRPFPNRVLRAPQGTDFFARSIASGGTHSLATSAAAGGSSPTSPLALPGVEILEWGVHEQGGYCVVATPKDTAPADVVPEPQPERPPPTRPPIIPPPFNCQEFGFPYYDLSNPVDLNSGPTATGGPPLTAEELELLIKYARLVRSLLQRDPNNVGAIIRQVSGTPLEGQSANAAAAERLRASLDGHPYQFNAGHVPDTAVTGLPDPPCGWLDLPSTVNGRAGGPLSSRVGQRITHFTIDGVLPHD